MDERSKYYYNMHAKRKYNTRRVSLSTFFSQTIEEKKNHIEHPLYKCQFKQGKTRWNSCLASDKYFESGFVKRQQEKVVDLKDTEKNTCRKILKSNCIAEDGNEE